MSEKYQMTQDDEAVFRRSALEQIALKMSVVCEGAGAPLGAIEPSLQESGPALVDESVTIEAKKG